MSRPPRPPAPAAARGGYGARSSSQIPPFSGSSVGQGSQDPDGLDWMENGGVGLLRRRVVPPTGFSAQMQQVSFLSGGQPPQFPFPGVDQLDSDEDFAGEALLSLFGFLVCSE